MLQKYPPRYCASAKLASCMRAAAENGSSRFLFRRLNGFAFTHLHRFFLFLSLSQGISEDNVDQEEQPEEKDRKLFSELKHFTDKASRMVRIILAQKRFVRVH